MMKLLDQMITPKDAREILDTKDNSLLGRALKEAMDKYPDKFRSCALSILGVVDELEYTPPRKVLTPMFKVRRKEFPLTELVPVLSLTVEEFYMTCSDIMTSLAYDFVTYEGIRNSLATKAPYLSPQDRARVINFITAILDLRKTLDKETGIYHIAKKTGSVSSNTMQDVIPYYNRLTATIRKGMTC